MAQNDRNTRIAQKAFEMVDKVYVIYQYSNGSTITEPVVPHPTERPIKPSHGAGGGRPLIGHANRFERPKGRAINCDEAFQLCGGVLIKEFRK
ncbi:BnaC07g33360D [Brassica napus]|uniref:BnaC07g33360D protein n=1 Tax=Brassica napus TaxID=3708 RepID=A0A078F5J7_BRANA|nr:BnaC07g33360D [Brassica napus]